MEQQSPTKRVEITGQLERVSLMANSQPTEIVTVRPDTEILTRQS